MNNNGKQMPAYVFYYGYLPHVIPSFLLSHASISLSERLSPYFLDGIIKDVSTPKRLQKLTFMAKLLAVFVPYGTSSLSGNLN